MNHFATPEFWFHDRRSPVETRELADRCFAMLEADPRHTSLRLKDEDLAESKGMQQNVRGDILQVDVVAPLNI